MHILHSSSSTAIFDKSWFLKYGTDSHISIIIYVYDAIIYAAVKAFRRTQFTLNAFQSLIIWSWDGSLWIYFWQLFLLTVHIPVSTALGALLERHKLNDVSKHIVSNCFSCIWMNWSVQVDIRLYFSPTKYGFCLLILVITTSSSLPSSWSSFLKKQQILKWTRIDIIYHNFVYCNCFSLNLLQLIFPKILSKMIYECSHIPQDLTLKGLSKWWVVCGWVELTRVMGWVDE